MKLLMTFTMSVWVAVLLGCGTTKTQRATQQLLMSDAVDRAVASIDFHPLNNQRVYLDTQYLKNMKIDDLVNADYITSSLRQQMVGAGCLLSDTADEADFIAEVRVGALGTDAYDMVYGIPSNNALSNAAMLMPNTPAIPIIPEIAIARKSDEMAATKIAVFAYHRETRRPVWRSGLTQALSKSKDTWILGAGPFQSGTIHGGMTFVDGDLPLPLFSSDADDMTSRESPLAWSEDNSTNDKFPNIVLPERDDAEKSSAVKAANFEAQASEAEAAEPSGTAEGKNDE